MYDVAKDLDCFLTLQLLPNEEIGYRHLSHGIVSVYPRQFLLKEPKNFGIKGGNLHEGENLPFEKIVQRSIDSIAVNKPEVKGLFETGNWDRNVALCVETVI